MVKLPEQGALTAHSSCDKVQSKNKRGKHTEQKGEAHLCIHGKSSEKAARGFRRLPGIDESPSAADHRAGADVDQKMSGGGDNRPNISIVMCNLLRAEAVGALGGPAAQTPNFDALAGRGPRFTNVFAQHSVCSLFRARMFRWLVETSDGIPWSPDLRYPGVEGRDFSPSRADNEPVAR